MTVIVLVLQLADSQFVTILRLLPRLSGNLFGYALAASGFGALLSAILVGRLRSLSASLLIGSGALVVGIGFGGIALVVALQVNQWVIPAPSFLAGAGAGMVITPFELMVQRATPNEFTGRVFGLIGSLTTGAALVGPLIGGIVITLAGAVMGFLITGFGLATIGVIAIVFKSWIEPRSHDAKGNGILQESTSS